MWRSFHLLVDTNFVSNRNKCKTDKINFNNVLLNIYNYNFKMKFLKVSLFFSHTNSSTTYVYVTYVHISILSSHFSSIHHMLVISGYPCVSRVLEGDRRREDPGFLDDLVEQSFPCWNCLLKTLTLQLLAYTMTKQNMATGFIFSTKKWHWPTSDVL